MRPTMQDLDDLGFEVEKNYSHDHFQTKRYKKGCLTVELTYDMSKNGKKVSSEVQVDDGEWREIILLNLYLLDNILNED